MEDFDQATALEPTDREGVLLGALSRDWWGGVGPHGGYLAAVMLRGLTLAAGGGGSRPPRSLSIHFLRSPVEGPFELHTSTERRGRALSTVSLRLVQGGEPAVVALGAVAAVRRGPELSQASMPEVPAWRDVAVTEFPTGSAPAFAERLEHRHCIGPAPLSGDQALTGGWIRLRERRALDALASALFMDGWWPAVWGLLREVPRVPTIDLTLHLRSEIPASDEPALARFRSRLVSGGFIDEEGELWGTDGRLLVQSRQLALLLVPPGAL